MKQSGMVYWGAALIGLGGLFLAGTLLGISVFKFLWPLALIVLGVWLLLPKDQPEVETAVNGFISEVKRSGEWVVTNTSYSSFISDIKLDMTQALLPKGETVLYFSGFIGDIKLRIPEDVAVQVTTSSFIADMKVLGEKQAGFFSPVTLQTADYKAAERRIRIETSHFISDIKVWSGDTTMTKVVKKVKASLS